MATSPSPRLQPARIALSRLSRALIEAVVLVHALKQHSSSFSCRGDIY